MSKPLIMVVEDDPILRDLTRRQIKLLGFDCVLMESGEAAVEFDPQEQLGLVFMDIGLPGIDGTTAASCMREKEQREQRKRVPIIALTGHSERQRALSAGMDDFLQKPALISDMKKMIEKYCIAETT